MLALGLDRLACSRDQAHGVASVEVGLVAAQRQPGGLGGLPQAFDVSQPGVLGRELGVLARLGVGCLDLAEAEAERVGLLRALAAARRRCRRAARGPRSAGRTSRSTSSTAPRASRRRTRRGSRAGGPAGAAGAGRTGRARRRGRTATEARVPTGTAAPPGSARERPSAETVRARITASSSRSAPASSSRRGDLGGRRRAGPVPDPGPAGAGAHDAGVRARAQQQAERGDDHRLAGSGLTGHRVEPRSELERSPRRSPRGSGCVSSSSIGRTTRATRSPRQLAAARASPRRGGRTWRPAGR